MKSEKKAKNVIKKQKKILQYTHNNEIDNLLAIEENAERLNQFGSRPTGHQSLNQATAWINAQFKKMGYITDVFQYSFPEWSCEAVTLLIDNIVLHPIVNSFSPSCDLEAEFRVVMRLTALLTIVKDKPDSLKGKILVLGGELTKEYLFPKNYPFITFPTHVQILTAIEQLAPEAVIFISHSQNTLKPILDDEQFTIPSVTLRINEGKYFLDHEILLNNSPQKIKLVIQSTKKPNHAEIITANYPYRGDMGENTQNNLQNNTLVFEAHIDTYFGSVGAHDNSSGVLGILELAQQVSKQQFSLEEPYTLSFVIITSHELSGQGTFQYFAKHANWTQKVKLFVNLDAIGHKLIPDAISFYNISDQQIERFLHEGTKMGTSWEKAWIMKGDPWFAGEHTYFAQQGVACLAVSCGISEDFHHTPQDTFDMLDLSRIKEIATILKERIKFLMK